MKGKQLIILSLAFILPISIFIFLKTLGKNEFAVEPFHQEGVITVSAECGPDYKTPYTVPSAVLKDLLWDENDSLSLYMLVDKDQVLAEVVRRLAATNTPNELSMSTLTVDSAKVREIAGVTKLVRDVVSLEQISDCFFIMEKNKNAILLDNKRRVRGYYNVSDREEVDRLAVEITIILKKY